MAQISSYFLSFQDIKPSFYIYHLFELEHENDYIDSNKNSSSTGYVHKSITLIFKC